VASKKKSTGKKTTNSGQGYLDTYNKQVGKAVSKVYNDAVYANPKRYGGMKGAANFAKDLKDNVGPFWESYRLKEQVSRKTRQIGSDKAYMRSESRERAQTARRIRASRAKKGSK